MTDYTDILVAEPDGGVAQITLHRPKALNALRTAMLGEVADAVAAGDANPDVSVIVITGGPRVFAAGADVHEMAARTAVDLIDDPRVPHWQRIAGCSKPLIAAVNGYALGAGCELALSCDLIVAGEKARFGQPEIKLGILPGAGGTQRLVRLVGKSMAMKLVLTGEPIGAREALRAGLVAEVTPPELTIERAMELAHLIASRPPVAVRLGKECLLRGMEADLDAALALERKAFCLLAATEDRAEGLAAFIEKRKPVFKGR